ncbi:type II toxin-antitoxin system VapC family toxin [Truepera radiovictrix]|uniref:PilT protein domain protein n=1 Tax=Truepera radiovictrix (strain DSM 17093 / CIP 108686 / LMG 22925 / RQ-24) TaxID=649638 RepID=D7CTA0_TRURR|nr:type II toxin-antitoxin system VapC family toxin [Truepera radiovictrix]ADI15563.1 PilT protein domain protein [Truepera radiovictrix DSM 17093]
MRLLLDTHALAWAVGAPQLLSRRALALLSEPQHTLLVSPVSLWEMSIKYRAGRWPEVAPFVDEQQYTAFAKRLGLEELPIRIPHARLAGQFDTEHKDPFDRLLAAQALLEGVPLVSKDPALSTFPVAIEW